MKMRLTIAASKVDKMNESLSEDELNDVMDNGLTGYAAVEAAGKATQQLGHC